MASDGEREPLDRDDLVATVVIPTRDRPAALAAALAAISAQTIASALEVVVVDDGSQDEERIDEILRSQPRARLIRIDASGPSVARNVGAERARAELLLFTDDDCLPAPDWAERLTEGLRAGADVVAGATVNGAAENRVAEASQVIANSLVVRRASDSRLVSFAPSNNLGCRADVLRFGSVRDQLRSRRGRGSRLVRATRPRGLRDPVRAAGARPSRSEPRIRVVLAAAGAVRPRGLSVSTSRRARRTAGAAELLPAATPRRCSAWSQGRAARRGRAAGDGGRIRARGGRTSASPRLSQRRCTRSLRIVNAPSRWATYRTETTTVRVCRAQSKLG